ncbi:hypothetical protein V1477_007702 [Vespula maculifrons]|uniref:Uncharacterized protein n=1 Tax=Vespula maculifrons TaxID=7453 RepID=A0ABD2CFH6_VESMC
MNKGDKKKFGENVKKNHNDGGLGQHTGKTPYIVQKQKLFNSITRRCAKLSNLYSRAEMLGNNQQAYTPNERE